MSREFLSAEEVDHAISSLEEVVRTCDEEGARSLALTALAGLRVKLGLWNQEASPWIAGRIRFRNPRGHLRINRRTDGELHD